MNEFTVDLSDIQAAADRIAGAVHRTPIARCATLDRLGETAIHLKCENLQRGGAFKIRGATNAVRRLAPEVLARGLITHSSGNHAQAVAITARDAGVAAHIVMPSNAPRVKVEAVRGYGAEVVMCEPTLAARQRTAAALVERLGGTLIPSYDHPDVIAGQGTIGLELVEQVAELDAVFAPVGGGGLLSGITLALRALAPHVPVIGVEPAGADDAARSRAARMLIPQQAPDTVADGLRTSLGRHTWPVVRDLVDDIIVVDDQAIVTAMRLLLERAKLVVEPSGATSLAGALAPRTRQRGFRNVAVVLSGGNVDLDVLGGILALTPPRTPS